MIIALMLASAPVVVSAAPRDLSQRWLLRHNIARAAVGVQPLVWDNALARDAARWARHLAQTGEFEHAPQPEGDSAQGENLWMGTRDAYSAEEMVDDWIDEKAQYRPGVFPDVARRGTWHDVGHYTQIIWQGSTRVGCALASNKTDDVLVCRYFPAGNVIGERPVPLKPAPVPMRRR